MIGGLIWMLFAVLTLGAACTVAFSKNILHCAFGLLGTLVGVCALYIFLGADFLAITQVVVYVGGILVLILFGVMMTHRLHSRTLRDEIVQPVAAGLTAIVVFGLTYLTITSQVWPTKELAEAEPTTREIGKAFLSSHLFPFEFASILLLVAMMGAALLSREKKEDDDA